MRFRCLAAFAIVVIMSGCSSYSSNLQVGNDQAYSSLRDQREAVRTINVTSALPAGAQLLDVVSAGRCHRSFVEEAPTEATVLMDLKIAAYAKGADGITDVAIEKNSGLNRNCWYVLGGTAKAYVVLRDEH